MAEDFEFRGFMLQVSKDMTENDFTQIKYLLKGYIPNARCEELKAVCDYFEELERMRLLTPTNFGVLKKALDVIGRRDLVENIEQKEKYFVDLFGEKKGDSLGPKEYDAVCDGITKAAGKLPFLPRSGQNTPELQKKLKLTSLENEDDVQLDEIIDAFGTSAMSNAVTELPKDKKIKKANHLPLKEEERPMQSHHHDEMRTGGDHEVTVKPSPQMDNDGSLETPLKEAAESISNETAMFAEDHLVLSKTTQHFLAAVENKPPKTDQKEPSEDTLPDCNEQAESGNMLEAVTDGITLPAANIPSYVSDHKLDDDAVTDGNEDGKGNEADSKKDDEKTAIEHQGPQHAHGPGARPKEPPLTTAKTAGPSEKTAEQADEAKHQSPQHAHGPGARPKNPLLMTTKSAGPSKADKQNATEQADEVTEAIPHGTLFAESSPVNLDTLHSETTSCKEPTQGDYSGPSTPTGDVYPDIDGGDESDELYTSDEKESAESLKEEPKSSMYGPGQGASASKGPPGCYHPPGVFSSTSSYQNVSGGTGHFDTWGFSLPGTHGLGQGASAGASKGPLGCHHPPGVFSSKPSYQKASGYGEHAVPAGMSPSDLMGFASAFGLHVDPNALEQPYYQVFLLNQLLALQQNVSEAQGFNPSTNPFPQPYCSSSTSHSGPAADSPLQANCYSKAGYSVVITHGQLCESTDEKGVVIMESGSQFCIVLANDNDYAAEVDITFGGMYLGVWIVEAKQSLSSPLVIEGSSWAPGRLKFFGASDVRKPQPSADIYGENPALNGRIELEFKPEVKTMQLHAKHVREKELVDISIIDSKTTTVGDLKQEISKKWKADILYLLKGGEVLQEDKTIRSYALNQNEVIEVLNTKEELKIESIGRDAVTMMVDLRQVSVENVKDFIAKKIGIQVDEQLVRFKGQDVDSESLTQMFMTSKEVPVLKVDKDRIINVNVYSPNIESGQKIEINWFATVDDLKEKLDERNICDTSATLKFGDQDISAQGGKKLIDLGFKNKSEITVSQTEKRTHRGFSASAFDRGSRTRGFGGGFRGFDNYISPTTALRGLPSETRTLRGEPDDHDVAHDSSGHYGEEGVAVLYGDEENVLKQFQVDNSEQQFLKEKAVTLVIQLKAKSMGATGAAASPSVPSGAHYSGGPTGAVSTPTPPPVPE